MDLSNLQTNSNKAMPSDIANNSSMFIPFDRDIFLSTYRRQNFSLPNSLMHYTAKNPKNTKVYQKMVESCKYFFIKNPIFVFSDLLYSPFGWETWVNETWKSIDMNKLLCKLWITDELHVSPENVNNNSVASSIIPKLYQCDVKRLILCDQVISFNELIFLCSFVKDLDLHRLTVKNEDGNVVALEKLIEQLPKINRIIYCFKTPSNNTLKKTFKQLWKIPHLSNYHSISLSYIPQDFDIDSFYFFMKKNKKTRVYLRFSDEISEEYKNRLEEIVDEVIETENHEYRPPCIDHPGIDEEKYGKLYRLYSQ